MIKLRARELNAECMIDISRIKDLHVIERRGDRIRIGAATTYHEIISDPLVKEHAPVLARAASCVGSVQIRNAGTLGGNAANASPAADSIPALLVHGAVAEVQSMNAVHRLPVEELITGPYQTALKPGELITAFEIEPMPETARGVFRRIARRKSLSIARMNCAAWGVLTEEGVVARMRISVGAVTPRPGRMRDAEEALKGAEPDSGLFLRAARLVSRDMIRRSGVRPSTEYKKPALEGLIYQTLMEVFPPCRARS
jgi:CO/xanthine dehydrogenase FAD-binding subunit